MKKELSQKDFFANIFKEPPSRESKMTLRQSLYALVTVLGLGASGCDNPGVDPDTPADLLATGKCAHGDYAFFETPGSAFDCNDYRLHVKTPQGANLILRDYCTDKRVDFFPGDFLTQAQAQAFYDACVPEKYRKNAQPATPVEAP